ncbi:hypothetical protein HAX54_021291 [Datura stramonium]|uniref:Tubulin binding cofactor C-like domain-containing protein n=1 Tax=Datura stramonium TaxID=4076 RepID=A0ABS8UUG4_DATST|nr:hypothetical protein [Datura stramonium]
MWNQRIQGLGLWTRQDLGRQRNEIRIHQAKGCDFYLRARSRPIIEDSNGVRFAPYCLKYDGIEKDLEEANLGEEMVSGLMWMILSG